MNFDFSDEQKQLRDEARKFLAEKCAPKAVRAVLDGRLSNAPMRKDANFGFLVPESAADVPADVIDPRASWANKKAYDETARGLTRDFEQNFGKYEPNVGSEIKKVAIRAAA